MIIYFIFIVCRFIILVAYFIASFCFNLKLLYGLRVGESCAYLSCASYCRAYIPLLLLHMLIQCCLFQDPNRPHPEGAEADKLIIASLMQTYRDPKILRFLQDVVKRIDAAVLTPRPSEDEEEPSSVILKEIKAPGPVAKGPLPRPRSSSEQSEHGEVQRTAPKAEAGAAPVPTDGVGAT